MNYLKTIFLLYLIFFEIVNSKGNISDEFKEYPSLDQLSQILRQYGDKMYKDADIIQNKVLGNSNLLKYITIGATVATPPIFSIVSSGALELAEKNLKKL